MMTEIEKLQMQRNALLAAIILLLEEYQGVVDADRTNRHGFDEFAEVVAARAAIKLATEAEA